jgi:hypothetical protein
MARKKLTIRERVEKLAGVSSEPKELRGLPKMNTENIPLESPRPLADQHCQGGYEHRFELWPAYSGPMGLATTWWPPDGKPPVHQCKLCGHWRDPNALTDAQVHERINALLHRQIPSTSEKVKAKGGWGARAKGALGR